ncbi:FadR/GntR family transcriptional regulator [Oceanobacillus halophilus]|uniref:FadR family transcriptional regulator n=1 Tax=Oceanobacillus halophilus TaxID=930130 RepID=A0A494ZWE3_9BACI|nr:FadR/GntR family transcriptional regulator [Oceanobacillus halophilus]RKQ30380.1 FadR family transcriptional regulator [Oceanobacillus halophilus]
MRNRSDEIASKIGRKIVSGSMKAGEKLPKVEDLSEDYGVSRTVVREALQGLSARKIVRSNKRSGTVVLPSSDWQWWDLDVMNWISDYQGRDGEFFLDMTNVRLGMEPVAAALAARNATEKDKEEITICFQNLKDTINDTKKWAKADYNFHLRIIEASHNSLMISLLKLLHKGLVISREKSIAALNKNPELQQDKPTLEVLNRHRDLYDAIMTGDEEKAKTVMTNMILRVQLLFEKTLLDHNE